MRELVIIGAGGHAKVLIDAAEQEGKYRIRGLIDSHKPPGFTVHGYPVLGDEDWLVRSAPAGCEGLIAVGDNWTRGLIAERIRRRLPGLRYARVVHPRASLARGAAVGEGTVVLSGAVLGSDAVVGRHGILYSGSILEHESRTGDCVSLAPGAVAAGNVAIGDYTALGVGANVIHSIQIGMHCVIGAGSTVVADIGDYTVAYGTPARPIRTRNAGERYL
ncbi:acetyltransferase [Paenibacillus spiritus]|uniref:Acetyltransferase n=1 Tax=Paenibacillus spiritus TaxID=2496557 RepID=A0A5J5FX50_9BACL|nr:MULTISPECIES: acetyltransferase [Paenibacillus]KAA8997559.1 acetyltransferase [Paenibacillus spiritus]